MQCEENTNEDIINFSKCTSHDILYFLLLLLVVFYIKSWEGRGGGANYNSDGKYMPLCCDLHLQY